MAGAVGITVFPMPTLAVMLTVLIPEVGRFLSAERSKCIQALPHRTIAGVQGVGCPKVAHGQGVALHLLQHNSQKIVGWGALG